MDDFETPEKLARKLASFFDGDVKRCQIWAQKKRSHGPAFLSDFPHPCACRPVPHGFGGEFPDAVFKLRAGRVELLFEDDHHVTIDCYFSIRFKTISVVCSPPPASLHTGNARVANLKPPKASLVLYNDIRCSDVLSASWLSVLF